MRVAFVPPLLALLCVFSGPASAGDLDRFPNVATVRATGHAEAEVIDDRAEIVFHVEATAKQSSEVSETLAQRATRLTEALRGAGAPEKSLRSFGPSIQDKYRTKYDRNGREITAERVQIGYDGWYGIRIRGVAPGSVAPLVKAGTQAGGVVLGVSFSLADEENVVAGLRRDAARQALGRAKDMAEAVGMRPGRVLVVGRPGADGQEAADMGRPAPGASSSTFPILPGTRTLSAEMEVILEMLQP